MKIYVRLLSGGSIEINDVNPKGTVLNLKECIARQQGEDSAAVHRQRLIWRGQEIKDPEPLSSFGINDGAIVHMVVRPIGAIEAAASQPAPAIDEVNFTTVELNTPQNLGSARSAEQHALIYKVVDLATRVCMVTIMDGVVLWMSVLLYDPVWVPICIFAILGYYGAANYNAWLLSVYSVFLIGICTVSAYIFISEMGMLAYIGLLCMAWHLFVILMTQRLIYCISSLPDADIALIRSVDSPSPTIPTFVRPASPRIWVPSLRRAAAPAA